MKPKTIKNAALAVVKLHNEAESDDKLPPNHPSLHHSFGMNIRNDWNLWDKKSDINKDASENYGISHGDDLSGLITEWATAIIEERDFEPLIFVEKYKKHWRDLGIDPLEA